jgi:hypothetical protein
MPTLADIPLLGTSTSGGGTSRYHDITLMELDFHKVKDNTCPKAALRMVQLLEDDGSIYSELLNEAKLRLKDLDLVTYNRRYAGSSVIPEEDLSEARALIEGLVGQENELGEKDRNTDFSSRLAVCATVCKMFVDKNKGSIF